ncbi:MAG: phosphodiester glycosidase family protein [Erysipelotrichaceae bacterium]|nr:phosphodiester glycosidase family protein [Erysipelotrichaceae bacterium]
MLESKLKTYTYPNGEIQRIQIVKADSWDSFAFIEPKFETNCLEKIAYIYKEFMVKKMPIIFGRLNIFYIPEDVELPFTVKGIKDKNIAAKIYLTKHYHSKKAQEFIDILKKRNCFYLVKGRLPINIIMPYSNIGLLSNESIPGKVKFNTSFFSFDVIDADSKYDVYGTAIGLRVKDGKILNPPQFNRETLIVDNDNQVSIKPMSLKDINISIKGTIYERPNKYTPKSSNYDVVIIGNKVVDIHYGGKTKIPSTGYIISTKESNIKTGDTVTYSGLEDIKFAIQVGNSIIINNEKTTNFKSSFFNVYKLKNNPYPPSMYPLNFDADRAPRMALGADENNRPTIVFFEGSSKNEYQIGIDSCGASLLEMANILSELKIKNAINLDGGGSAQILIDNKRELKVSNRDKNNNELERPVPLGISIN